MDYAPHLYFRYTPLNNRSTPTDSKTMKANLDLAMGSNGSNNPGAWVIKVCIANALSDCGNDHPSNILGKATITVSPPPSTPTPTPAQNLPIVDFNAQTQCSFQAGSSVTIQKITNIQPNTWYRWWWDGDRGTKGAVKSDADGSDISFTIPGAETQRVDVRKFCIDIEGLAPGRNCLQNGISLTFTAGPPPDDSSCSPANAGDAPPPEQLPLSCSGDRCKTALGEIETAPEKFIGTLFGIILGLSGGIALLLIIFSGYKLMTSQGNPEKVQGAKETLTSAIVGLLFIIFSLVILQIIGVDLLRIPGFQ